MVQMTEPAQRSLLSLCEWVCSRSFCSLPWETAKIYMQYLTWGGALSPENLGFFCRKMTYSAWWLVTDNDTSNRQSEAGQLLGRHCPDKITGGTCPRALCGESVVYAYAVISLPSRAPFRRRSTAIIQRSSFSVTLRNAIISTVIMARYDDDLKSCDGCGRKRKRTIAYSVTHDRQDKTNLNLIFKQFIALRCV